MNAMSLVDSELRSLAGSDVLPKLVESLHHAIVASEAAVAKAAIKPQLRTLRKGNFVTTQEVEK